MAVTQFTAAISGSGKTYRRCAHFLATEFLPYHSGRIWTNFPIHIDAMLDDVMAHHPDMVASQLRERIKIIPEDVLKSWRTRSSGPWEFFAGEHLEGDRIAIDEIHNYVPTQTPKDIVTSWMEFLGELRHRGCEFEALSQYDTKVHKAIREEAGLKRDLFNCESRRDPFFGILMADWYNIRAKFITGQYTSCAFEYEYIPVQGKWKISNTLKFNFEPRFFKLYDSYSAPIAGGKKASGPRLPWSEKTKGQLLAWFLFRNWFNVLWRFAVVALVFWLCFLGGATMAINGFIGLQKHIMQAQSGPVKPKTPGASQPAPVAASAASAPGAAVGPTKGEGSPAADQSEMIQRLNAKITQLSTDIESKDKEILELKNLLDRQSDITLLGHSYAITRSGAYLQTGDYIPLGQHKGKVVAKFDYRYRCIILDDGTRLGLVK